MADIDAYRSSDPNTSSRYGYRLERTLDSMYSALGCAPQEDYVPYGAHAEALSAALHDHLYDPGGIAEEMAEVATRLRRSNDPEKKKVGEEFAEGFLTEKFGLFLWLRARGGKEAEYAIRLIGTSAYQHREASSLDRVANIRPGTRHAAAQCLLDGRPFIRDIRDERSFALWGCLAATPFNVVGFAASTTHPHSRTA